MSSDIYITRAMENFEYWLTSWSTSGKKCALVYGDVGVGKTFTVKHIAEKHHCDIYVYGEDTEADFDDIMRAATSRTIYARKKVILLDRPLLWMSSQELKKLVRRAKYPIVIECGKDETKYYQWLGCVEIYVEPPPKSWIAKKLRERGVSGIKWNLIGTDVRQAELIALGAETYKVETWSDKVKEYFKTGNASKLEPTHAPVILDTVIKSCYGKDLLNYIQALLAADLSKNMSILNGLKTTFRVADVDMYYYQKLKALKEAS